MYHVACENGDYVHDKSKTLDENVVLFLSKNRHFYDDDTPVHTTTDFTNELLDDAKQYYDQGNYAYTSLLYATWMEHIVNKVIFITARKSNLTQGDLKNIIRSTNLRAKTTWLLKLLGLPEIPEPHQVNMLRLADMRNAFVHYKWSSQSVDDTIDDHMRYNVNDKNIVESFAETVIYLKQYYKDNIFNPETLT